MRMNELKALVNEWGQARREGGCDGCARTPPQTAEVHFFVKKINSKKKIIVLFFLPRCTQGGLSLAHF